MESGSKQLGRELRRVGLRPSDDGSCEGPGSPVGPWLLGRLANPLALSGARLGRGSGAPAAAAPDPSILRDRSGNPLPPRPR